MAFRSAADTSVRARIARACVSASLKFASSIIARSCSTCASGPADCAGGGAAGVVVAGAAWACANDLDTNSGGTVTQVTTGAGLSGGPITGAGTVSLSLAATGGLSSALGTGSLQLGIAPGANINHDTGHAVFEATHGTAPKYADLDKVNPGSVILSGEMMFRYMGWTEVADLLVKGLETTIARKTVTYDFARLMEGAKEVKCSEFGQLVAANMG